MSWLDGLAHRVRTLLRPGAYADELKDELDFHESLDTMHQGDPHAARRRLGNRTWFMEEARRMTWLRFTDTLGQDLRHAWRAVSRTPGLAALIAITLALGVGANAATFTLLDALYLRPPSGVKDPAALRRYWLQHFRTGDGVPFKSSSLTYPLYRALASIGDSTRMAGFVPDEVQLGRGLDAPQVHVTYATASYFTVLGVHLFMGRAWTPAEDAFGTAEKVAVVSHAFWQRREVARPDILGQRIRLGVDDYTIIGVADPAFTGLDLQPDEVWLPLATLPGPTWIQGPWWESDQIYSLRSVQRWDAGFDERDITLRATLAVREVNRRMRPQAPDTLMDVSTGPINAARGPGKAGQHQLITTRLSGVAVIVLIIAWANVMNLLLARAVQRRREIAVRLALGIPRLRLVRLLTLETVLLALFGAAGALLVAWAGGSTLRALVMPHIHWARPVVDARLVLVIVAVALVSGLVAGLVPAVQASRPDLNRSLKSGTRDGGHRRSRLRGALVVVQAALSVVLLVGAALFVRSLHNVQSADIGYDTRQLVFGDVRFAAGDEPPAATLGAQMAGIAERLRGKPGIEDVARAGMQPMYGWSVRVWFTDTDSNGSLNHREPSYQVVSPSYFQTTGVRLLRGTTFAGGDVPSPRHEVIVNDIGARLMWHGRDAMGQCLYFDKTRQPCYTVVGIVENSRQVEVAEPEPMPQFYLPLGSAGSDNWDGRSVIVRAPDRLTQAAMNEMRTLIHQQFPNGAPVVQTMAESLERQYGPFRLGARLFSAFGLLALVVALVGIYSTVSYGVSQRTHEFGVRIALGAQVRDVIGLVVGGGVRTVALGVALGIGLALLAGRLVTALLYGIEPNNVVVLAVVSVALLIVAALAATIPAWRASRVDPVRALQSD